MCALRYERCWRDYKFNFWRTLIAVLAMGPSIEQQHRTKSGIFAEKPTASDKAQKALAVAVDTAQAAIDDIQQKASTLKDKSVEACAGRCALAYSWHRVSSHRPAKRCA